jgi:hypothetical protein
MRSYRRRVTQDRQMPPEKPSPARRSPGGTKKPVKDPIRYLARELNGSEWAQGPTPKEALGALVHHFAIMRPLTVESVDFSY